MFLDRQINFVPDILLYILLFVTVAVCVGLYFLIPVINHKKYDQQREDLRKREALFNANKQGNAKTSEETAEEVKEA